MTDQLDRLTAALADRYRIERQLGAGGMATVYLAEDLKHKRKVAVKVLRPELAAVLGAERFVQEITTTANLQHPHILPLFDSGEADGFLYYVMPYIEGETLRDKLNREKQLSVEEAMRITRAVAGALGHAHQQGVIHRDIKPANILLRDDHTMVADFGIALAVSNLAGARLTETGISVGTPEYMSPEQASGERQLDVRTDVYSLGAVMYEMLAGEPPHTGGTLQAVVSRILTEQPTPLRQIRPRIPRAVDAAILRALDRVPADRYATANAFVVGLETPEAANVDRRLLTRVVVTTAALTALVTSAIAYVVTSARTAPTTVSTTDRIERPLTATGDAWSVALSRDGATVAYLTSSGLVTQDIGGGRPNLVLPFAPPRSLVYDTGTPFGEPRWLGDDIGFARSIDSASFGVYAVPRMGGEVTPRLVVDFLSGGQGTADFFGLPNGESIMLSRVLDPLAAAPWLLAYEADTVRGIQVHEEVLRLWDAAPSPDGRWIAYIGEREDRSTILGSVSYDGMRSNVILTGGQELAKWREGAVHPRWPYNRTIRWVQNSRLYYRQVSGRGMDLYVVDVDPETGAKGGDPRLVYPGLPTGASFDVSSDAARLVFSGGPIRTQVYLSRLGGNGRVIDEQNVTRGTARHVVPRISSDGQQLAYVRQTAGSEDIYVMPTAGGAAERVNVIYSWQSIRDLSWAPDGTRLAVHAETRDGPRLLIVSLSDARVDETATTPGDGFVSWSPDGRYIAHPAGDASYVVVYDVVSRTERRLFENMNAELLHPLFSPSGSHILIDDRSAQTIWIQSLEDDTRYPVAPVHGGDFPVHWSDDGTIFIYQSSGALVMVPWTGGVPRMFASVRPGCIFPSSASMGPDAGLFVCSADEQRESDVWVVDNFDPETGARTGLSSR